MNIKQSINDSLKCEHCKQSYNEYDEPRILPCCAKTLCENCILSIEKNVENMVYKCIVCNKESRRPPEDFIVNEIIVKLISEKKCSNYF